MSCWYMLIFTLLESSVSLPKYQPKMKTLDSFLSKLRSRKPGGVGGGGSGLAVMSLKTGPPPVKEERDK